MDRRYQLSCNGAHQRKSFRAPLAGRWRLIATVIAFTAGSAALFLFDPARKFIYPPCIFHWLTGLHCPGCGTLRSLHKLLHGEVYAAMRLNPLLLLSLPFLGYAFACWGARQWSGQDSRDTRLSTAWIWSILALIVAYWILRNIPVYPFIFLAPAQSD